MLLRPMQKRVARFAALMHSLEAFASTGYCCSLIFVAS